jgi:uncharacterized protein
MKTNNARRELPLLSCKPARSSRPRVHPVVPEKIRLVVIQPSPFCNIDCRYCYLPDRSSRKVIDETTLAAIYERLFASQHLGETISILWHSGEPLAVPIAFYENAFRLLERFNTRGVRIRQLIQTNCTLLTQPWCDFIKAHHVNVGISIDGPQRFHDANRVTRSGQGTFERAMRGVRLLQRNGIPVHNIAVLTGPALDHPEEVWDFFVGHDLTRLAFNVDEVAGANLRSSVRQPEDVERYRSFFRRLLELKKGSQRDVRIRELDDMETCLRFAGGEPRSALNLPLATLSFDCDGNISTFSPELVTLHHSKYQSFQFGNVHECGVDEILEREAFLEVHEDIQRGIAQCRATCPYFSVCGGGVPANKLGENNTFDSTETMQCRLTIQAIGDLILSDLETSCLAGAQLPGLPVAAAG